MSIGSKMPYQRRGEPAASGTGSLVLDKHRRKAVAEQRDDQAAREELRKESAAAKKGPGKEARKHMG